MSKFTVIVKSTVDFNVDAYSIHTVVRQVQTTLLAGSPRGAKCRESYALADKDGGKFLICTVHLQNMRGTELEQALILSEEPEVPGKRGHANRSSGEYISCKTCGGDQFYDVDRELFYERHVCASCGAPAQTLTETGACT